MNITFYYDHASKKSLENEKFSLFDEQVKSQNTIPVCQM